MTLSFSTTINGKPTYFIEKIWNCFLKENRENISALIHYQIKRFRYNDIFGSDWDKHDDFSLDNPKLHSIRADHNNRWRAGMDIHPVIYPHGRYSKIKPNRFQFAPVFKCVSVQEIEIYHTDNFGHKIIFINSYLFYDSLIGVGVNRAEQLAINDGFDSVEDFFAYFDRDFTGKIIHWTDLKY